MILSTDHERHSISVTLPGIAAIGGASCTVARVVLLVALPGDALGLQQVDHALVAGRQVDVAVTGATVRGSADQGNVVGLQRTCLSCHKAWLNALLSAPLYWWNG